MSLSTKQKSALEIQRGILQAEDEIVLAIQKALGEIDPDDEEQKKVIKGAQYGNLEESQFRNLVRAADSTESTEAIKNFLRYQTGRDTGKNKKWGQGKNSLAEQIIQDIDGLLKQKATEIADYANAEDVRSIHIKLIRLYLGYGTRHLTYINSLT